MDIDGPPTQTGQTGRELRIVNTKEQMLQPYKIPQPNRQLNLEQ